MHGATHIKVRSGVYQYDRRVPKHIREAFASLTPERLAQLPDDINAYFNHKIHIRFSLATGDKKLAKTLGNQADLKFDGLVSRFDAWLAQGAQTYDVLDADTLQMWHRCCSHSPPWPKRSLWSVGRKMGRSRTCPLRA